LTWNIEQDAKTFKFSEVAPGKDGKIQYECSTAGKECEVANGKDPEKISMYYNGAALVQFHRAGSNGERISKQKLQLSDDKKALLVEIDYMAPEAKPEKLVFLKQ
jgi:hypothetical protein